MSYGWCFFPFINLFLLTKKNTKRTLIEEEVRKHFKMVNVVNHSISIERPRLPQLHECGIPNCRESEFISHTQPVTVRFSWNSPRLNMSGSVLEAWEGGTSKQFAWVSSKRRNWVVPFYLNWIELLECEEEEEAWPRWGPRRHQCIFS